MQTATTAENPQKTPVLSTVAGAVLAIIGALMSWVTLGGTGLPEAETYKGTDSSAGLGTLGLAVIIIILAIVMWIRGRQGKGRGQAIAAFVLALIALFASAYSAFAAEDAVQQFEASDVAELYGISEAQAEAGMEIAFEQGQLEADPEVGTYVSTLGSLLMVIGSFLGMRAGKRALQQTGYGAPATTPGTPAEPQAGVAHRVDPATEPGGESTRSPGSPGA